MNNKTTTFSKHKGVNIRVFKRDFLTLIFLAINVVVFSQIKVAAITTGYHTCFINGIEVDNHTQLQKATTHITELKLTNPDKDVWFEYPVQTRVEVSGVEPTIIIDTIQVNRRLDVDGNKVGGFLDNVKSNGYFLVHEIKEMICYPTDSIPNWKTKYNFKRTKTFGKVSYENLTIPFQYMEVYFLKENSTQMNMYAKITEKQVRITAWLDGIKIKEFIPGASFVNEGEIGFNYYFGIRDLIEGVNYSFKLESENEDMEVIVYQTTIRI